MMEKMHTCKRHGNAVFIAAFYNGIIADGAAGHRNIGNTASVRSFDIVAEREESIGAE